MHQFATIIPIGPGTKELERARDLLESLFVHEPSATLVVLLDDGGRDRNLPSNYSCPSTCRLVSIQNPRNGRGVGPTSGLAAGMIAALSWIERNAPGHHALKLDTDALIVAPFSQRLCSVFASKPEVGMIGLYRRN